MNQIDTLKELLGAESGSSWVAFMDYVGTELAQVLRRGKPRKQDIEESIIGNAGFTSWSEMIETPTAQGGLGWNLAAWDSWKRAYSVVQQYPYLRDLELTASAINTAQRETKPDFPATLEAWNDHQGQREQLQVERQQNSLADAKKMVGQLETQLAEALNNLGQFQQRAEACEAELLATKKHLTQQAEEIGSLKQRLIVSEPAAAELASLKKKHTDLESREARLRKQLTALKTRGFLARVFNW